MPVGDDPTVTVVTTVCAAGSITDTVPSSGLVRYTRAPPGSTATPKGLVPSGVMEIRRGAADTPERPGEEHRGAGADLVDRLGETGAHVVALEIAVEADDRAAEGVLLEGPEVEGAVPEHLARVAGRLRQHVLGCVLGEVERDRVRGVDAERHRVGAARELGVAVLGHLARLAEDRVADLHLRLVAGVALHVAKDARAAVDRRLLGVGQVHEAEARELELRHRPGLRRLVERQRGYVADGQLVGDTVAVAVHARPDELDTLHAHLVGGGAPDEVTEELLRPLPLEPLHDQVLVEALDRRRVDGAAAADRDRAEARALRREGRGHRGAGRAGLLLGVVADRLELRRHLLREALDRPEPEDVRRVAADPKGRIARAPGVADHVAAGVTGAVTGGQAVAAVAGVRVRARDAFRDVAAPHRATLGVVADEVSAREAAEARAVADVGTGAVDGVEEVREDRVAVREGVQVSVAVPHPAQRRLVGVLELAAMQLLDEAHFGDDRPRADATSGEQRDDGETDRETACAAKPSVPHDDPLCQPRFPGSAERSLRAPRMPVNWILPDHRRRVSRYDRQDGPS